MRTTSNKRKKAVVAVVAAAAILLAGTFAWTSISQIALNESAGIVNVGGRLHDDFNGENKDVYVENFTDPLDGGQPIYARVRLDEYMEVGQDAGGYGEDVDGDGIIEAQPVVAGTNVKDVNTWTRHIPADVCTQCQTGETCKIHTHWTWEMGGQTTYMPTFNKDKDSLKAEINGTYEGLTKGDTVHYDDYVTYTEGQTLAGSASYDDDTNTVDEGNVWTQDETHTAKKTAEGTVILMSQWIAEGEQPGPYWVYDTDGWAYWAQPIMPGEATGLLLSSIDMVKNPGEKCYYGINVVGQFATVGDWEYFEEGGEPTPEAERLLEAASQHVPKVSVVNVTGDTTLAPGESADFTATTSVGTLTGYSTGDFEWTVYNEDLTVSETSTITDNGNGSATLHVGADEQQENLIVAAKSTDDAYAGAVGLSTVTIKIDKGDITKLPITLSRADGCRYIKQGEATSVTAALPDGVSANDVTFTVEGDGVTGGYEIDQNGDTVTVTVDDTIPVGTWITIKATSSKAEGSLELVVVTDTELQFFVEDAANIAPVIDGKGTTREVYEPYMTTEGMPLVSYFVGEFTIYNSYMDEERNLFSATGREPIVTVVDKTSADTRVENGRLYIGEDEQSVTLRVILADAYFEDPRYVEALGTDILYIDGETTFTLEEPPEPSRLYVTVGGTRIYGTADDPYVVSASTEEQFLIFGHGSSNMSSVISKLYITPDVDNGPYMFEQDGVSSSEVRIVIPANAPVGTYTVTLKETGNTENDTFVFVIQ